MAGCTRHPLSEVPTPSSLFAMPFASQSLLLHIGEDTQQSRHFFSSEKQLKASVFDAQFRCIATFHEQALGYQFAGPLQHAKAFV